MPQQVSAMRRGCHTSPADRTDHSGGYRTAREWAPRRPYRKEDPIGTDLWPSLIEVGKDGVAHLLRQRQFCLPAAFSGDFDTRIGPVDVWEAQGCDVTRSQTEPRQKE